MWPVTKNLLYNNNHVLEAYKFSLLSITVIFNDFPNHVQALSYAQLFKIKLKSIFNR
jgi:hypothetical protein